jgi:hypothetical protein
VNSFTDLDDAFRPEAEEAPRTVQRVSSSDYAWLCEYCIFAFYTACTPLNGEISNNEFTVYKMLVPEKG